MYKAYTSMVYVPVMSVSPSITIRLPEWVMAKVRQIAALESRTVGAVIRLLVMRQLGSSSRKERE